MTEQRPFGPASGDMANAEWELVAPVLTDDQVRQTAESIAAVQLPNGMIPWFPEGHADPWNHVEAAMAMAHAGLVSEAERAYRWLDDAQLESGAWHCYYWPDGSIEEARLDTNVCAYIAAGVLHQLRTTGDVAFAEAMWPTVERAVDWVVSMQRPGGEVTWAVLGDGSMGEYALLTGSSSVYHSLRCAVALAEDLDLERPGWELAAGRLATALAFRPQAFEPKDRWAMDWYYPVLCGAVAGEAGRARLDDQWDRFIIEGDGCRCVDDRPWVTAAETAECAMAHATVGRFDTARTLLDWVQQLRHDDGSYWTGIETVTRRNYPGGEQSTYTSAAIVLADDCLSGTGPTSGLFRGHGLPHGYDLDLAALAEAEADAKGRRKR